MSFHGRRKMMEMKAQRQSRSKRRERARKLEKNQAEINAVLKRTTEEKK